MHRIWRCTSEKADLQRYEGVDHARSTVRDSSMLLVITFEVFKMISVNVSSSIVTFDY